MMGGGAAAMLNAIARLELTEEQRSKLETIREDLNERQKELFDKITSAGRKLQQLHQEQMEAGQTMSDLNGHMAQANMDAANRAEELLTVEQRQRLIGSGAHVMAPQHAQ
jgi:DNA-binding protein H-NS